MRGFVEAAAYQRLSEENERLRADNAWLKAELGLSQDATAAVMLADALSISSGEAALLASLHAAKPGRVLTKQLLEDILPCRHGHERSSKVIDVLICRLRAALGHGAIETAWGSGYRLTPAGRRTVDVVLAPSAQKRAA